MYIEVQIGEGGQHRSGTMREGITHEPGAGDGEGRYEEEAGEMARIYNMNGRSEASKTSSAFLALSLPPATAITSPATD